MKKMYGFMGFAGITLIIGAAGGTENCSVAVTAVLMAVGVLLIAASEILVRVHEYNRRFRRAKKVSVKNGVCARRKRSVNAPAWTPALQTGIRQKAVY